MQQINQGAVQSTAQICSCSQPCAGLTLNPDKYRRSRNTMAFAQQSLCILHKVATWRICKETTVVSGVDSVAYMRTVVCGHCRVVCKVMNGIPS